MANSRWGDAISRLLADRGWNRRQLADAASVRPNTITNLLTHGKDSDTGTLSRIAAALNVDIAELFLTREQSVVLKAHHETRVERLKEMVVKELSATVSKLVEQELERSAGFSEMPRAGNAGAEPYRKPRRKRRTAAR